MEFIATADDRRIPIPDAVVAAADNRDMIARYAGASDIERKSIEAQAVAATTPVTANEVAASPTAQIELHHDE